MRCDGLVAATPAGSTGYNLANPGPILAWGVEGYVVSFIAPHTLTARAAGRRPRGRPARRQRARAGAGGRRAGRRARRRAGERRRDRDPLPRCGRPAGAAPGRELLPPHAREVRAPGASRRAPAPLYRHATMERKWWTLLAVCVATFMLLLDITIVNVALPSIQEDLDASFSRPAVGRRRLRARLASFLLVVRLAGRPPRAGGGSSRWASRSSPSPRSCAASAEATRVLNLFRALQGVGGAAMFATALALIAQEFEGRAARHRDRDLGGDRRRRRRRRPAGRRAAHRRARLGVDLLRQRPDRDRRDRADGDPARERLRDRRRSRSTGPAWRPSRSALFGLIFGLIRGNAEGWGSAQILVSLIGAAVLMAAFVADRAAQPERDARPVPVPRRVLRRGLDRRLGALGQHVRDVPLPHALHPGRPRVRAARGGRAVPAGHPALVLRRPDRGQAVEADSGPRPDGHRAHARRRRALPDAAGSTPGTSGPTCCPASWSPAWASG